MYGIYMKIKDWLNKLHSTNPTPLDDLRVRVMDLKFLCSSFTLKLLVGPHYLQTLSWIWFIPCMKIYFGPNFYAVPSLHDLRT